jgi:hypothetical protein
MKIAFAATAAVIVGIFGLLVLVSVVNGNHSSAQDYRTDVIGACQDSVKQALKDPDSAQFSDWTASESAPAAGVAHYANETDYSASGMVNAKNGFGGYDGNQAYSCDAAVHDGTVNATAHTG